MSVHLRCPHKKGTASPRPRRSLRRRRWRPTRLARPAAPTTSRPPRKAAPTALDCGRTAASQSQGDLAAWRSQHGSMRPAPTHGTQRDEVARRSLARRPSRRLGSRLHQPTRGATAPPHVCSAPAPSQAFARRRHCSAAPPGPLFCRGLSSGASAPSSRARATAGPVRRPPGR